MMKKIIIAALALPLLTACGFTPMHGSSLGANAAKFEDISIQINDGRDAGDKEAGFLVMQRLRDRIGENTGKHILELTPKLRRQRLGISADDVASRYDSILEVNYKLMDAKTGRILNKGKVKGTSTFGAPVDPYGIVAADNNAKQQTAKEVADRLLVKLAGYYADQK
ncbi:LPS assembly lipoprotein LptE [Hellea balneolensis]|uniref:LPS assembly lipoprotein LptE n=1 Tax=Hellea balneolensis TaxID=287478 RepID=UPI000A06B532|nr:LPS assembly lipoprotein LptE [Hellea balneolensis]